MELTVGVADPEETAALRDFFRWLRNEEEPPGEARLSSVPVPGTMSGGFDVIDLVLTHSTGMAGLALAFAGWRRARRNRAVFTVTRASDGLSVTVEDGSEETVRKLLQALVPEQTVAPATEPQPDHQTAPASGTSVPGTSGPSTPAPGTSGPGSPAPGTSDPGSPAPGTSGPGSPAPGTSDPGSPAPGTSGPGASRPGDGATPEVR